MPPTVAGACRRCTAGRASVNYTLVQAAHRDPAAMRPRDGLRLRPSRCRGCCACARRAVKLVEDMGRLASGMPSVSARCSVRNRPNVGDIDAPAGASTDRVADQVVDGLPIRIACPLSARGRLRSSIRVSLPQAFGTLAQCAAPAPEAGRAAPSPAPATPPSPGRSRPGSTAPSAQAVMIMPVSYWRCSASGQLVQQSLTARQASGLRRSCDRMWIRSDFMRSRQQKLRDVMRGGGVAVDGPVGAHDLGQITMYSPAGRVQLDHVPEVSRRRSWSAATRASGP